MSECYDRFSFSSSLLHFLLPSLLSLEREKHGGSTSRRGNVPLVHMRRIERRGATTKKSPEEAIWGFTYGNIFAGKQIKVLLLIEIEIPASEPKMTLPRIHRHEVLKCDRPCIPRTWVRVLCPWDWNDTATTNCGLYEQSQVGPRHNMLKLNGWPWPRRWVHPTHTIGVRNPPSISYAGLMFWSIHIHALQSRHFPIRPSAGSFP